MNALIEKRNNLYAEASAIVEKAKAENRGLTEEEQTAYSGKVTEIRSLDGTMQKETEIRGLALTNKDPAAAPDETDPQIRAWADFFRTGTKEYQTRNDVNMTYGANGALIPNTILDKVVDRVKEISPLLSMVDLIMVPGTVSVPYIDRTSGDITVAFSAEFSTLTANVFKFNSISLGNNTAASLVKISRSLINNAKTDLDVIGIVVNKMSEAIAYFLEGFVLNGDQTVSVGSGMLTGVTQRATVANAAALTADKLIETQDTVPAVYQPGACWIMAPGTRTAIRKLKDGQNNYLLVSDFSASGPGYTLLGKPVYVTENLPAVASATAGQNVIYYGDFSGVAVKLSPNLEMDVLREKYAEQHAVGVNAWFEVDSKVENAQKIAAIGIPATT